MRLKKWQWRKKQNHEVKSVLFTERKYSTRKRKIITNFKMNAEKSFVVSRLDFLRYIEKRSLHKLCEIWTKVLKKYVIFSEMMFFLNLYKIQNSFFVTLWFTVQLVNGKGKFYIFERIDRWNSHIKYFNSQSSSWILSNLTCKSCNRFQNGFSLSFQLLLSL